MGAVAGKIKKILTHPRVYLTVEPVLFVFMFSQFLSYSAFQQLVHTMVCARTPNCSNTSDIFHNKSDSGLSCSIPTDVEQQVQKETSHWILYVNVAMGVPAILFSLFYGSFSDQLGRKPFIFLPALGAALNTAVILEMTYQDHLPMYMFLIGAFTAGLYGGFSVLNSAAYSYAADTTAKSGRTCQIGLLESMTYLGATLSLLVGGVWISKDTSYASIFWCVLACQLAVLMYTVCALPESMQFTRNSATDNKLKSFYHQRFSNSHKFRYNCGRFMADIKQNMQGFFKLLLTNWQLSTLLIIFFMVELNFVGITDVIIIYTLGEPLCWGSKNIGYFLALKVFLNGIASLIILPIMLALQLSDSIIVMIGLVAGAAGFVVMGIATKTWIMFTGMKRTLNRILSFPNITLLFVKHQGSL